MNRDDSRIALDPVRTRFVIAARNNLATIRQWNFDGSSIYRKI
jgi:hypothetical protein